MLYLRDLEARRILSESTRCTGRIVAVRGPVAQARLPSAALGNECVISLRNGRRVRAFVVSFTSELATLAPFDSLQGVAPSDAVECLGNAARVKVSLQLGSVVDALGNDLLSPMGGDYQRDDSSGTTMPVDAAPPGPIARRSIEQQLVTGIKGIDTLCPIGYGQRIALMAGAGIGKSTLLASIACHARVDVCIIALVGERGREVSEFVYQTLGAEGLRRSIVVAATSDQSAVQRSFAAASATAIAEYHRKQGKNVLLLVDSLTRTARAIREVGLAAGEIPVRQGLTPSVYSELPRLLERAGNDEHGSITAIYTLLDTSEREFDPLAEEVKSLLDGHICLAALLAEVGVRPAIDYSVSISRLATRFRSPAEQAACSDLLRVIARLKRDRDIVLLGGTPDPELKACIDIAQELRGFLCQTKDEGFSRDTAMAQCMRLSAKFNQQLHN